MPSLYLFRRGSSRAAERTGLLSICARVSPLKVRSGKCRKNHGMSTTREDHDDLWNTFRGTTGASLPLSSAIVSCPEFTYRGDLLNTFSTRPEPFSGPFSVGKRPPVMAGRACRFMSEADVCATARQGALAAWWFSLAESSLPGYHVSRSDRLEIWFGDNAHADSTTRDRRTQGRFPAPVSHRSQFS